MRRIKVLYFAEMSLKFKSAGENAEDHLYGLEKYLHFTIFCSTSLLMESRERSGSVVERLTRDRRVVGSSLTGVTALWSLSKTHLS